MKVGGDEVTSQGRDSGNSGCMARRERHHQTLPARARIRVTVCVQELDGNSVRCGHKISLSKSFITQHHLKMEKQPALSFLLGAVGAHHLSSQGDYVEPEGWVEVY